MKPSQLEAWALRVVGAVQKKQPIEDTRVELKAKWPDDQNKAARRIAGHANASHGEPVLWLIGLDEVVGVVGADQANLANWWPGVKAEFESLPPTLIMNLNVPWKGLTVVALLFETDRAPFVVKNATFGKKEGGAVSLEVPWRDGTSVRSARRDELLRLLVPLQMLPDVEVLSGSLAQILQLDHALDRYVLAINLDLYVTPHGELPLTIPFHKCSGEIRFPPPFSQTMSFEKVNIRPHYTLSFSSRNPPRKLSVTAESTPTEVHFTGPANVYLEAKVGLFEPIPQSVLEAQATIRLQPIGVEVPVSLDVAFGDMAVEGQNRENIRWYLKRNARWH